MVGDGKFLPITNTCSINLLSTSGNLPLRDVLLHPAIAKILLFVYKLTIDYPCSFKFDCDGVRVWMIRKQKLLVGSNHDGMYLLEVMKCSINGLVILILKFFNNYHLTNLSLSIKVPRWCVKPVNLGIVVAYLFLLLLLFLLDFLRESIVISGPFSNNVY